MTAAEQSYRSPLRIGLTGGIASGKSTVADMFAELGATIIDTDVIAREIVMPGQPALDEIRDAFGAAVIEEDGSLNRTSMRKLVFADEDARRRLEAILHPRIREETRRRSREAEEIRRRSDQANAGYQLIVIPLLVESALKSFVDRILVVDCNEAAQIRRLLARDAESEVQARRMLAAQATREQRLAVADDVIINDDNLANTRKQVAALHEIYLSLA